MSLQFTFHSHALHHPPYPLRFPLPTAQVSVEIPCHRFVSCLPFPPEVPRPPPRRPCLQRRAARRAGTGQRMARWRENRAVLALLRHDVRGEKGRFSPCFGQCVRGKGARWAAPSLPWFLLPGPFVAGAPGWTPGRSARPRAWAAALNPPISRSLPRSADAFGCPDVVPRKRTKCRTSLQTSANGR